MGGKQSIVDIPRSRVSREEIYRATEVFRSACGSHHEKGCTYEDFVDLCTQIHPLLTQFLEDFYFANNTDYIIESVKEFLTVYSFLVRGSLEDKVKVMEALLLQLKDDPKKTKQVTPASALNRKFGSCDVNYDIDNHTFRMRVENYLRGLICSYIKLEYTSKKREFHSWRRVRSRFSVGDIDKLARTLEGNMQFPSSPEDLTNWVKRWKTVHFLHYIVYGNLFGEDDLQSTKSLYPLCVTKHFHNVCLMDMCSVMHLNCHLLGKYRQQWRLIFSTAVHGWDFRHLMEHILNEGPNLVVIKDKEGHIFGGFAAESWRPCAEYYGHYSSFLFQIQPNLEIFESSGKDGNYQHIVLKGLRRGIGMGKGTMSMHGWWIDPERQKGSCALSCPTFQDLPVLASSQHFEILNFEVWAVDVQRLAKHKANGPAVRFYTFVDGRDATDVRSSNIHEDGKHLLVQKDKGIHTDGHKTNKAAHGAQKWLHLEEEEDDPHLIHFSDDENDDEDGESDVEDEDEEEVVTARGKVCSHGGKTNVRSR